MKTIPFVSLALASQLSAALYETEAFNYTTLNGATGGTGWSTYAWDDSDGDITLATGSLSYPASSTEFSSSGNRISLSSLDTGASAFRRLGTNMSLGTSGNVFFSSALFNISATTGQLSTVSFLNSQLGTGDVRWQYGINTSGNFIVSVAPGGTQMAISTTTASINTTYLLVAKIRTNTLGGLDQVFLKIFAPDDDVFEPLDDSGWDLTAAGGSTVLLESVRLNMTNGSGQTNQFDELRIGTTFNEVAPIPEPSAACLLILGSLAFISRRRR